MMLNPSKVALMLVLSLFCSISGAYAALRPGEPGKNRGDIIAPMLDEQIAAWCDFNKQIVVTRTNILCAYVGKKPNEASPPKTNLSLLSKTDKKKLTPALPKDVKSTFYEMSEYGDT